MNKRPIVFLILVCLLIGGCITQPHHVKVNPNKKPGEVTLIYNILEVPLFAQETRMWCWAASGEMIMDFYEEEVPQHVQANNRFNRSDCGPNTRSWGCIKGGWPQFIKYGFNLPKSKYGPLSWQELQEQIQAYQPVGFSWEWKECKGKKSSGSHYMVARGYIIINDTRLVVVNDPLPMSPDKYKGGTVSIMTYDDYVQFCPRYIHSYTHYEITKPGSERLLKQKLLRGGLENEGGKGRRLGPKGLIGPPCHGAQEALELLKALPWAILKELGFESMAMVEKSKLGKKFFYNLGKGSGYWQNPEEEIPADVFEVHYPVEVDEVPLIAITIRKREGKWVFAVINDSRALSAVKALDEMIAPRDLPPYFMVQIQSMNLSFLAYFLVGEEEEEEEVNKILYFTPTHEDPDLSFSLYERVSAVDVFTELKYLLEQMAVEKGGAALKNQFTGYWHEMDQAFEDLGSGEETRALRGVKQLVEIINDVFGQLESQNGKKGGQRI